jgi:hypothetical protein
VPIFGIKVLWILMTLRSEERGYSGSLTFSPNKQFCSKAMIPAMERWLFGARKSEVMEKR